MSWMSSTYLAIVFTFHIGIVPIARHLPFYNEECRGHARGRLVYLSASTFAGKIRSGVAPTLAMELRSITTSPFTHANEAESPDTCIC